MALDLSPLRPLSARLASHTLLQVAAFARGLRAAADGNEWAEFDEAFQACMLDELKNDITRETPANFEPSIDYVVTKIPRFAFEKFPQADPTLTTQMKSVGETMAIGRTFKESLQKCLRSLEIGRSGLGGDGKPWRIAHVRPQHITVNPYFSNRSSAVTTVRSLNFAVAMINRSNGSS